MATNTVAALVGAAFVQRLVEDSAVLEKVESDEAAAIGRAAAEKVLASARWAQVVGDRLDTTQVSELLGITRQALAKRQATGSVVGLPGQATTWYPTWQFNLETGEIRPEVRDIVGAFRDRLDDVDPLLVASWATTSQEDLDNLTPAQWLQLGNDPQLLRRAAERAASRLGR